MKWLTLYWYKYLFKKPSTYNGVNWFTAIWCRLRNHPAGVVYYSSGWEPNTHCKNCGDDLG